MEKTVITKQQAIEDIKTMFNVGPDSRSSIHGEDNNAIFLIDKNEFSRLDVVTRLHQYFADKAIKGGGCYIDSITMVSTNVYINDIDVIRKLSSV